MDFWRRTLNETFMKVGNTITDEIRGRLFRWYGHVQRMEEQRLPKQIPEPQQEETYLLRAE